MTNESIKLVDRFISPYPNLIAIQSRREKNYNKSINTTTSLRVDTWLQKGTRKKENYQSRVDVTATKPIKKIIRARKGPPPGNAFNVRRLATHHDGCSAPEIVLVKLPAGDWAGNRWRTRPLGEPLSTSYRHSLFVWNARHVQPLKTNLVTADFNQNWAFKAYPNLDWIYAWRAEVIWLPCAKRTLKKSNSGQTILFFSAILIILSLPSVTLYGIEAFSGISSRWRF